MDVEILDLMPWRRRRGRRPLSAHATVVQRISICSCHVQVCPFRSV